MHSKDYNAESIEVLSGLDPVKKRPNMFTDTRCPNHLGQELADNAVDEALAGFATSVYIRIYEDGSLEVEDNGRGMPTDIHPIEKISAIELILTRLHAGGKFSNKHYKFSGGLHGVGVSVVNALSEKLEVYVKREGKEYFIAFENGNKTQDLVILREVPFKETGTKVRFWPNAIYFDDIHFNIEHLKKLLRSKAVLCPGLKIIFQKIVGQNIQESQTWYYPQGITEYIVENVRAEEYIPSQPIYMAFKTDKQELETVVLWALEAEEKVLIRDSYVNLIPTPQEGTHVQGLRNGLLEAMREFCEIRSLLTRGIKLVAEDVWQSCLYVLSVKLENPQFVGQTKERLASRECVSFVQGIVKDAFGLWLNQHIAEAENLARIIIENAQKRLKDVKKVERKKIILGPRLPGKLSDCLVTHTEEAEIFIVEGDSAGGSAKQGRNKSYQAVLSLRGKILNTWEAPASEILQSQEIEAISIAIGVEPGSSNLQNLRYNKICILADADADGLHIATLLCALFVKHFYAVVKAGHVYLARPPLYRIDNGKEVYYALDEEQKQDILKIFKGKSKASFKNIQIQRFKGLGEMNPLQLRETTMDPKTRRLVQLTIEQDAQDTFYTFDMLLGKKRVADRKAWLEQKGNLIDIY